MSRALQVRRAVLGRRLSFLLTTRLGRFLLRRSVARKRERVMRVVGGVTLTGLFVVVLLAEREAARRH